MIELTEISIASEQALVFARERLYSCLRISGLSRFEAGRASASFSQSLRSHIPVDIKFFLDGTTIILEPGNILGKYSAIKMVCDVEIEKIKKILNMQSREELLQSLERQVAERTEDLQKERNRVEELLFSALPEKIVKRLQTEDHIADKLEEVTILFADVVGFTELSVTKNAGEVVLLLDGIFQNCDKLAKECGVEPIKTIGDAYMAATGLPEPQHDHLERMLNFSLAMIEAIRDLKYKMMREIDIRVGLHTGPVVAGVIGQSHLAYDVWGDTVNTASRMESNGVPGRVHVSKEVYEKANKDFEFEERGTIFVKGKGPMKTYFLLSSKKVKISETEHIKKIGEIEKSEHSSGQDEETNETNSLPPIGDQDNIQVSTDKTKKELP